MGLPSRIYGVKWEPVAAMILLLLVGVWLIKQPDVQARPGAYVVPVRIANDRGIIETFIPDGASQPVFRLALRSGYERVLSGEQLRNEFGQNVHRTLTTRPSNALFRLFNITSWASLTWIAIGFLGQFLFAGRTLVQWFVSEKERQSVVPEAYWWMSLIGGVTLFAYFAWRQDVPALLGQCSGVVIYARNIRLIHKHRRRAAALASSPDTNT
jgi:lipid-A-disaccharide synthase-like uncharacterized protein